MWDSYTTMTVTNLGRAAAAGAGSGGRAGMGEGHARLELVLWPDAGCVGVEHMELRLVSCTHRGNG